MDNAYNPMHLLALDAAAVVQRNHGTAKAKDICRCTCHTSQHSSQIGTLLTAFFNAFQLERQAPV